MESVAHPYSGLTPDVVLNALDGVGLRCDGTLLALNSFENRVYQVGIDDAAPLVAKFYRPGRWSDADQFKTLKASHGGACCDALLRDMARLVTQSLRQPDLLGRYGTEALVVFLPNTDPMGALDVAERIRERVAGHTLRWQNGGVSSTVSVGVASVGASHMTLEALLQDGLGALQAAKDAGRNCVRAAPIQPRALAARSPSAASGGPRARRPGS